MGGRASPTRSEETQRRIEREARDRGVSPAPQGPPASMAKSVRERGAAVAHKVDVERADDEPARVRSTLTGGKMTDEIEARGAAGPAARAAGAPSEYLTSGVPRPVVRKEVPPQDPDYEVVMRKAGSGRIVTQASGQQKAGGRGGVHGRGRGGRGRHHLRRLAAQSSRRA